MSMRIQTAAPAYACPLRRRLSSHRACHLLPARLFRVRPQVPPGPYSNGSVPGCSCCASNGGAAAHAAGRPAVGLDAAAAQCGGGSAAGQPSAVSSGSTGLLQPAFLVGMQGAQPVFMLGPPEGRAAAGGLPAAGGGQFVRLADGGIMQVSPSGYAAHYTPHSYVHCASSVMHASPACEGGVGAGEPSPLAYASAYPPKGDQHTWPPREAADALTLLTGAAHTAAAAGAR